MRAEAAELAARRREAEEATRRLDASLAKMKAEESRVVSAARLKMREEIRKAEGELARVTEEMRRDRKIDTVRKASSVIRAWKEKAHAAEEDPAVRTLMSRSAPLAPGEALFPGRKVFVVSLSKEAEVAAPAAAGDREVEVAAGGMKVRVPRDQVRVFPPPGGTRGAGRTAGRGRGRWRRRRGRCTRRRRRTPSICAGCTWTTRSPRSTPSSTGRRWPRRPTFSLIHGHGTGALKTAVRRHLAASPTRSGPSPPPAGQGGDGVTIVILA